LRKGIDGLEMNLLPAVEVPPDANMEVVLPAASDMEVVPPAASNVNDLPAVEHLPADIEDLPAATVLPETNADITAGDQMTVDLPAESTTVPSVDFDGDAETIEAQFSPLSTNYTQLPPLADDPSHFSTEELLSRAAEGNPIPLPAVPTFNVILATPKTSQESGGSPPVEAPTPLPSLFPVSSQEIEAIPTIAVPSQVTERPLRRSPRSKSPSPSPQATDSLVADVVPVLRRSPRSKSRSPQPE